MKIVIVGASGNIGSALVRALKAEATGAVGSADHNLVGVARRPPAGPPYGPPYDGVVWHAMDVADPTATRDLTPLFDGADAVVNLAWGFQPARDVDYLRRVGVGGLAAVLSAATSAGVPHLVHMSSVGAYSRAQRGHKVDESWPTAGIASLPYSVHKAAAEELLDEHVATGIGPAVCRLRPGLVMQRAAGSSLLRYGAPLLFPSWGLDLIPVLPLDRSFAVPVVHARDVAAAVVAAVTRRATGAFNLAAASPLTAQIIADTLRARLVSVPWRLLQTVVAAGWELRLERLDPGWIDLAFAVPLLDTARAADILGWTPVMDASAAFREVVSGMRHGEALPSPALRPRGVGAELRGLLNSGAVTRRRLP